MNTDKQVKGILLGISLVIGIPGGILLYNKVGYGALYGVLLLFWSNNVWILAQKK